MKHKFFIIILVAVAFVSCDPNLTAKRTFSYIIEDGEVTLTEYNGLSREVEIPTTIDGLPVTGIQLFVGSSSYNKSIRSIVIPEGVKSIKGGAFSKVPRLESVTLPSTLESIGNGAFSNSSLSSIVLPQSLKSLGANAFEKTRIIELDIPASLEVLGNLGQISLKISSENKHLSQEGKAIYSFDKKILYAYQGTDASAELTLPDSVEKIEALAFSNAVLKKLVIGSGFSEFVENAFFNSKIEEVVFLGSLAEMPEYAFVNCSSLKKITLPSGLVSIGKGAFSGCSIESIELPAGLEVIGDNAFGYPGPGVYVSALPSSLKVIGESALIVKNVKDFELHEGLEVLPYELFSSLESINIPSTVKKITFWYSPPDGFHSFQRRDTEKLKSITVSPDNKHYSSLDGVLFNKNKSELILYPYNKSGEEYSVPSSVVKIGNSAFAYASLKKVNLPEGLVVLGPSAFHYAKLESVALPKTLKHLGPYALYENSFKSIVIPASLEKIGSWSIGSYSLVSVTFEGNAPIFYDTSGAFVSPPIYFDLKNSVVYYYKGTTGWDNKLWKRYNLKELSR
ncbi:MAG: leucine-rich repeat domain-containing protein [Spirochaetales bacterium]|nr:leucine-rich repeat domain-containing protein [Spirochaetales bacterium]